MDIYTEKALGDIQVYFDQAASKIDAMAVGDKVAATALAEEIALAHGKKGPQLYMILKFYFDARSNSTDPDIKVTRGAKGGITKIK